MKTYTITVNGVSYDVTVEEKANGTSQAIPAPQIVQPAAQPVQPAAAPKAAPKAAPATGSKKVEAGAAGKVMKLTVKPGDTVKSGDTVAVLEIMKMETPIVTSDDGTVCTIEVNVGDMIEAGATIATLD